MKNNVLNIILMLKNNLLVNCWSAIFMGGIRPYNTNVASDYSHLEIDENIFAREQKQYSKTNTIILI
jgi:hypothetical protein